MRGLVSAGTIRGNCSIPDRHIGSPIGGALRRDVIAGLACAFLSVSAKATPPDDAVRRVTIDGVSIPYRIRTEPTTITGPDGTIGTIVSFSYLRDDVTDRAARPVLFVFNGGPGASSVWLHLGAMGPMVVRQPRDVDPASVPPFDLMENDACPLDQADLVFIDPIGTGFSRLAPGAKPGDAFGVEQDARTIAQFIDRWLTLHDRWNSPKFIMGESYGTVRAAVLQRLLMGGPRSGGLLRAITIDGIILVGATLRPPGTVPPVEGAVALLPTLAATAWYHRTVDRGGRSLADCVERAIAFAEGPYLSALHQGSRLTERQRGEVAGQLVALTGLPRDRLVANELIVTAGLFVEGTAASRGRDVGLYDSRYTLARRAPGTASDPVADDPAMAQYTPAFAALWHRYLRDLPASPAMEDYRLIAWSGVNDRWTFEREGVPDDQSYAIDLAAAMRRNPQLRLLLASGYFDLATPFRAAEDALAQAYVPLDRVRSVRYDCGHMVYLGASRPRFLRDVRGFLARAGGA
jgi:carboxypeptidase C (cathepsin A)